MYAVLPLSQNVGYVDDYNSLSFCRYSFINQRLVTFNTIQRTNSINDGYAGSSSVDEMVNMSITQ
jgi:hypothetical protein